MLNFNFFALHTKLPHNKLWMALKSLIDFCFDEVENKYIALNNYGACCIKFIKHKITDAVTYFF